MKPKIYKIGLTWILWVPGVRVYRFASWERALGYALDVNEPRKTVPASGASREGLGSFLDHFATLNRALCAMEATV